MFLVPSTVTLYGGQCESSGKIQEQWWNEGISGGWFLLCSQVYYRCDQERSCIYDIGIYFARYQIKIIARNCTKLICQNVNELLSICHVSWIFKFPWMSLYNLLKTMVFWVKVKFITFLIFARFHTNTYLSIKILQMVVVKTFVKVCTCSKHRGAFFRKKVVK